jgi:plastocyanin
VVVRRSWKPALGALLIGALLAGGCSSPPPPPPPASPIPQAAIDADRPVVAFKVVEQSFEPGHVSVKVNVPVTISVTNTTAVEHNLTVKDPEGHRVVDARLPVGETISVAFAPTTAGTYIFFCKYALHRTFGEEGTLEVR